MMKPLLEGLLRQAGDRANLERQRDAIRQLWHFLEMKNRPVVLRGQVDPRYERELPESLRLLALEEGEEQALVAGLHGLVVAARSGGDRPWSPLSVASPRLVIEPLLDLLLRRRDETWTADDDWGLLFALRNALDVFTARKGHSFYDQAPAVAAAIREHDPRAALHELAAMPDDRLSQLAQHVRDKVEKLFEDPEARPSRTFWSRLPPES
jgi:hypothetical protein